MLKSLIFVIFCSSTIAGCAILFPNPPGKGAKAEAGYRVCNPIVEAIDAYKRNHGHYPSRLEELVPEFIKEVPSNVNNYPIWYAEDPQRGFTLSFRYVGPGMNECKYSPASSWKCHGWY